MNAQSDNQGELSQERWDAYRYVAGEMSVDEIDAFEKRMGADSDLCEAVADMAQLTGIIALAEAPSDVIDVEPNDDRWIAFRYVSGDMSEVEVEAFESRLADDGALCEIVAEVAMMSEAIVASQHEQELSDDQWESFKFVAGELDDFSVNAFEERLADDHELCETVADITKLTQLIVSAGDAEQELSGDQWQAFRYVAGEMEADEVAAFELRMSDDADLCEVVAEMAELSVGIADAREESSVIGVIGPHASGSGWRFASLSAAAAIVLGMGVALMNINIEGDETADETAAVDDDVDQIISVWVDLEEEEFTSKLTDVLVSDDMIYLPATPAIDQPGEFALTEEDFETASRLASAFDPEAAKEDEVGESETPEDATEATTTTEDND